MAVIIYMSEDSSESLNNKQFNIFDISREEITLAIEGAKKFRDAFTETIGFEIVDNIYAELNDLEAWKIIVDSSPYADKIDPIYTAKSFTRMDFYSFVKSGVKLERQKALKRWKDECRRYSELEKAVQKKIEEEA